MNTTNNCCNSSFFQIGKKMSANFFRENTLLVWGIKFEIEPCRISTADNISWCRKISPYFSFQWVVFVSFHRKKHFEKKRYTYHHLIQIVGSLSEKNLHSWTSGITKALYRLWHTTQDFFKFWAKGQKCSMSDWGSFF